MQRPGTTSILSRRFAQVAEDIVEDEVEAAPLVQPRRIIARKEGEVEESVGLQVFRKFPKFRNFY